MNPFGLVANDNGPRLGVTAFLDQKARKALCIACGVEFKEHDHSKTDHLTIQRPNLRPGMVVCGPCGNKVIKFTHYAEARGDRRYGPSGGGWEVIVATCPIHGNTVLRAMWKDLVANHGNLIVAFTEFSGALPSPADHLPSQVEPLRLSSKRDEPEPPLTIDV